MTAFEPLRNRQACAARGFAERVEQARRWWAWRPHPHDANGQSAPFPYDRERLAPPRRVPPLGTKSERVGQASGSALASGRRNDGTASRSDVVPRERELGRGGDARIRRGALVLAEAVALRGTDGVGDVALARGEAGRVPRGGFREHLPLASPLPKCEGQRDARTPPGRTRRHRRPPHRGQRHLAHRFPRDRATHRRATAATGPRLANHPPTAAVSSRPRPRRVNGRLAVGRTGKDAPAQAAH
jgi:hypothetical protein